MILLDDLKPVAPPKAAKPRAKRRSPEVLELRRAGNLLLRVGAEAAVTIFLLATFASVRAAHRYFVPDAHVAEWILHAAHTCVIAIYVTANLFRLTVLLMHEIGLRRLRPIPRARLVR